MSAMRYTGGGIRFVEQNFCLSMLVLRIKPFGITPAHLVKREKTVPCKTRYGNATVMLVSRYRVEGQLGITARVGKAGHPIAPTDFRE
jgi:hypothetical protein